jgi:hypothetical protein
MAQLATPTFVIFLVGEEEAEEKKEGGGGGTHRVITKMCIYDSHIHKSPEINSLNQVPTSLKGLSQSLNQVAPPPSSPYPTPA